MNPKILDSLLHNAGAVSWGIAEAAPVDTKNKELYKQWIDCGKHGEMAYLEKYCDVRDNPQNLLEGAKSIICAAFNYYHPDNCGRGGLHWARYALGDDYHNELRSRLESVSSKITGETGETCRVCVDTAPLRERYWALRSGVGFLGRNGLLIVPEAGSWCVLGFIITTLRLPPTPPLPAMTCCGCGLCVRECPAGALDGDGGMDALRCRSYLSIEYRGDSIAPLGNTVYGCDICQEVCPHNRQVMLSNIKAFSPRPEVLSLTREEILNMEQPEFSRLFKGSAIKRTKLAGLKRNVLSTDINPKR